MNKIKEIIKQIKVQRLVTAIAIALIGLMFIIFPESSAHILCYVGGGVLMAWGVFRIVMYFVSGMKSVNYTLVGGVTLIAVGIILCIYPDLVASIITIALGVVLIADGIVKFQHCVNIVMMKDKMWWVSLVVSIVAIVLGVIVLCDPFSSKTALMIFIGISLIVDAICDIVSAYRLGVAEKKSEIKNVIDID